MKNHQDKNTEVISKDPFNFTGGEVNISIKGFYHDGTQVQESYTVCNYSFEDADNSNSYRIDQQDPDNSSINILRFNDITRSVLIFIRFYYNGKSCRDADIRVETRKKIDTHRFLHSAFYLCDPDENMDHKPLENIVFDQISMEISGSFSFIPSGYERIVISGDFRIKLKKILQQEIKTI